MEFAYEFWKMRISPMSPFGDVAVVGLPGAQIISGGYPPPM